MLAFFIQNLFEPEKQLFFGCVVVTVVISIVLHELAHGWAAIWQGDDTPRIAGHMTPDPMVHMGGMSLLMLVLVGFAFGAIRSIHAISAADMETPWYPPPGLP